MHCFDARLVRYVVAACEKWALDEMKNMFDPTHEDCKKAEEVLAKFPNERQAWQVEWKHLSTISNIAKVNEEALKELTSDIGKYRTYCAEVVSSALLADIVVKQATYKAEGSLAAMLKAGLKQAASMSLSLGDLPMKLRTIIESLMKDTGSIEEAAPTQVIKRSVEAKPDEHSSSKKSKKEEKKEQKKEEKLAKKEAKKNAKQNPEELQEEPVEEKTAKEDKTSKDSHLVFRYYECDTAIACICFLRCFQQKKVPSRVPGKEEQESKEGLNDVAGRSEAVHSPILIASYFHLFGKDRLR